MSTPTKYFHDRLVLLLLILNSVLLVAGTLLVLFRLDGSKGSNYIVQYRANVGIGEFTTGNNIDMASFALFLLVTFVVAVLISHRSYNERRSIALTVLVLTLLMSVLTIIVSNALLVLR
jgi:hypothetical protein